jgi:glycerol-3-phosphate O-acyltransferase
MVTQFTHFEKVAVFSESLEVRPKVASLRQLSQQTELSVSTCQKIVRKDLDDSVTAERYRNNILDVFINQLQLAQHGRLFVICGNFLTIG